MSATYKGFTFRTPLEAQWAAFFDLAGWKWQVNPLRVGNWAPDFFLEFECDHSECGGYHTLLAAVLPYHSIAAFKAHPCLEIAYGLRAEEGGSKRPHVDGGAALGIGPAVTQWEIAHGSGGGTETMDFRVPNAQSLWGQAARLITVQE